MNEAEIGILCVIGLLGLAVWWLDRLQTHITRLSMDIMDVRYKLNRHYQKSGLDASKWVAR